MAPHAPRGVKKPTQDDFELCRRYNHAWDPIPENLADYGPPDPGSVLGFQRCLRCTSLRIDYIDDRTGDLVKRRYDYVDGYQYDSLEERPTRSQLRLRVIERMRDQLRDKGLLGESERARATAAAASRRGKTATVKVRRAS